MLYSFQVSLARPDLAVSLFVWATDGNINCSCRIDSHICGLLTQAMKTNQLPETFDLIETLHMPTDTCNLNMKAQPIIHFECPAM